MQKLKSQRNLMNELKYIRSEEHFDWLDKCLKCWRTCEDFIAQSIEQGKCLTAINICRDTAEMCSQCIKFEAQRSSFFKQLCEVCASICLNCSKEINNCKNLDTISKNTARSCEDLAEACLKVSQNKSERLIQ